MWWNIRQDQELPVACTQMITGVSIDLERLFNG
jgi:hypothetical protein